MSVVLQKPYTGEYAKYVLSPGLASTPCTDLGHSGLLSELNRVSGTSYTLDTPGVRALLNDCITVGHDLGTAYGHLRSFWRLDHWLQGDLVALRAMFAEYGANDHSTRERAQVKGTITNPRSVPPRRLWDLFAHRVIPGYIAFHPYPRYWPVSHSWTEDMAGVETPVNQHEWPVPMPRGITLEMVRDELLNLGAEYVWLDVVCLRQRSADAGREALRAREWAVDVPTIGNAYQFSHAAGQTVQYCNGLGRAFETVGWDGPRHWLNRAWTLQEINWQATIGGVTSLHPNPMDAVREDGDRTTTFSGMMRHLNIIMSGDAIDLFALLTEMKRRSSTNPIDKIAGLGYLLGSDLLPAYYESQTVDDAWCLLVDHMSESRRAYLLFLFPAPGDGELRVWMPSWGQIEETDLLSLGSQSLGHGLVRCYGEGGGHFAQTRGYRIERCFIRGLATLPPTAGEARVGELEVVSARGRHVVRVKARHRQAIPEEWYTVVGDRHLEHWVVCRGKWESVGTFRLRKVSVVCAVQGFEGLVEEGLVIEVGSSFM